MKRAQWTAGAARTQSILHLLLAPLTVLAGAYAFRWIFPGLNGPFSLLGPGLLPGLLVAFAAWGLCNQRAWARRLAMIFHGSIAAAALSYIVYIGVSCLTSGNRANEVHGPVYLLVPIFGGIACGVFILASGFLWWLWRSKDLQ
jgi:hypothetical protein